jgi:lysozyme
MLSQSALKQMLANLYSEEDYRQFVYDDKTGKAVIAPVGRMTFGIGWNIQDVGCPREIAEFAAMYFVKQVDAQLSKQLVFYDLLDEVRKCVLCDMAFNMGVEGLLLFHNMLFAMKTGDWHTASVSMINSKWAKDVGQRATKLRAALESGKWA